MRDEVDLPQRAELHERVLRLTEGYDALGHRFTVACSRPELLGLAAPLLAGLRCDSPTTGPVGHPLEAGEGDHVGRALLALVGNVNIAAINAASGHLLLHAGGLARADGGVVALCAPSGGGKSTLTGRLAQRGLAYLTDETLCLAPDSLRIRPFRKPLVLKPGAHALFPQWRPAWAEGHDEAWLVAPDLVGPAPDPGTVLTPDLLVFPRYERGATVTVEAVEAGEAAYLVGQQSSRLREVTGGPLPALARLARRARGYRLVHSDAEAAADAVLRLWDAA